MLLVEQIHQFTNDNGSTGLPLTRADVPRQTRFLSMPARLVQG